MFGAIILLTVVIFSLEFISPLLVGDGILYIALVLISTASTRPRETYIALFAATLLSTLGLFGVQGDTSFGAPLIDRVFALITAWAIGVLVLKYKKTQSVLNKSEERLQRVADTLPGAVYQYRVTPEGLDNFLYVSPGIKDVFGYTSEELLEDVNLGWSAIVPEDGERLRATTRESAKTMEPWTQEFRVTQKDGQTKWILGRSIPSHVQDDGSMFWSGIFIDITARKKVEEELRKTEERLQRVADTIPGAVYQYRVTPQGTDNFMYVSQGIKDVFGYSAEQLLEDINLGWGVIIPEDAQRLRDTTRVSGETMEPWAQDFRVVLKDGQSKWIMGRSIPSHIQADGSIFWSGIFIDITAKVTTEEELHESESRLRAILENAPDGIVITDEHGTISSLNPAAQQMFGYEADELIGRNMTILIQPPDHSTHDPSVTNDPSNNHSRLDVNREGVGLRKDGTTFPLEATVGEVKLDDDRHILTTLLRDVTDRNQAEEENRRLEAELRQAQKLEAIGAFTSGIAHDFGNLLGAITNYVDLTKTIVEDNEEAVQRLNTIDRVATHARDLTQSLLKIARKTTNEKIPVNLNDLTADSISLFRRLFPSSIKIVQHLPKEPIGWVLGDATGLQQVLINLALNARDAMTPRGGRLTISLTVQDPTSDHDRKEVVLAVQDTGTGIVKESLTDVLEPFFTSKPRGQGTGLGLLVVQRIVEDHGGRVDLDSKPGQGTRFTVSLPYCESQLRVTPPSAPSGDKVLLVGDQSHVRSIIAASLHAIGFEVIQAASGAEAMKTFPKHQNELRLVILDMDIPREKSELYINKMRQRCKDIHAIVVTDHSDATEDNLLDKKYEILKRPFQMIELTDLVNRSLVTT